MSLGLDSRVLCVSSPAGRQGGQPGAGSPRAGLLARERVVITGLVLAEAYFALHYHYSVAKEEATPASHVAAGYLDSLAARGRLGARRHCRSRPRRSAVHARHRAEGVAF